MKLKATPATIDDLLQMKALDPRTNRQQETIDEIAKYNLTDRVEQDIREDIITPLLKSIGYASDGHFYIDREVDLKVGTSNLQSDYGLVIYTQHHWIIEAKRPTVKDRAFNKKEILQGLTYAAHPDIDASLIVLCNGRRLTIYDREVSLKDAVFDTRLSELNACFDELRAWLAPWQVWFFEKRRGLRSVERALMDARNPGRVDDFGRQVSDLVRKGKNAAQQNARNSFDLSAELGEQLEFIQASEPSSLIEGSFFYQTNGPVLRATAAAISLKSKPGSFNTINRLFPDNPRDLNCEFLARSLHLLMTMERDSVPLQWAPSWLGGGTDLCVVVEKLFELCLTNFKSAPHWQLALTLDVALRRVLKILIVLPGPVRDTAQLDYALNRFLGNESNWSQLVDSEPRQALIQMDTLNREATSRLLAMHQDKDGQIKTATLKSAIQDLWRLEISLLTSVDYPSLLREADLGELFPTEFAQVRYDQLGHSALCYAADFPARKAWAIANLSDEITTVARLGSWAAKEWLGLGNDEVMTPPSVPEMAERFLLGNQEAFLKISSGYGWE